jgi:hypothetical protein
MGYSLVDGTVMLSEMDLEVIGKRMAAPRQPGGMLMPYRESSVARVLTGTPPA